MDKIELEMNTEMHKDIKTEADYVVHMRLHHSISKISASNKTLNQLGALHRLHHVIRDNTNAHPNSALWG